MKTSKTLVRQLNLLVAVLLLHCKCFSPPVEITKWTVNRNHPKKNCIRRSDRLVRRQGMALERRRQLKRRQRDRMRYLSFVSILSQNSMSADANWKMRVPTLRASQLPEELLETYEEAFYLLDPEGTGVIGRREVGIVMRAIGQEPTDEEIDNLVKEVDKTETGRLSFNDFLALLAHICQEEEPEEEWERVFQQFDHNKDGFIDENDLRKTMIQLRLKFTDSDVDEMLHEFAPLREGPKRIDFEDFLSILT